MRYSVFAVAIALSVFGCEARDKPAESKPAAPLVDVTKQSTLAAVRTAFNAHKGEARFLTLLSPT